MSMFDQCLPFHTTGSKTGIARQTRIGMLSAFLLITLTGCFRQPPSDFFPALTAAAATRIVLTSATPSYSTSTPALTPSPLSTGQALECQAEGTMNGINIRRTPGGDIIGCCVGLGEKLEIQKVDPFGEWVLIQGIEKPTHQGWVKLSLLKIIGDCQMPLVGG